MEKRIFNSCKTFIFIRLLLKELWRGIYIVVVKVEYFYYKVLVSKSKNDKLKCMI